MLFEFDTVDPEQIKDFIQEYVDIKDNGFAVCDLRFSKYVRFDERGLPYLQVYFKTLKRDETKGENG